jgi:hypothetical protein
MSPHFSEDVPQGNVALLTEVSDHRRVMGRVTIEAGHQSLPDDRLVQEVGFGH